MLARWLQRGCRANTLRLVSTAQNAGSPGIAKHRVNLRAPGTEAGQLNCAFLSRKGAKAAGTMRVAALPN